MTIHRLTIRVIDGRTSARSVEARMARIGVRIGFDPVDPPKPGYLFCVSREGASRDAVYGRALCEIDYMTRGPTIVEYPEMGPGLSPEAADAYNGRRAEIIALDPDFDAPERVGSVPAAASERGALIGFQIANAQGVNIQGDDEDPTGLASFEVMAPNHALAVIRKHQGLLLMPIHEGTIEEPTVITHEGERGDLGALARRIELHGLDDIDVIEDLKQRAGDVVRALLALDAQEA